MDKPGLLLKSHADKLTPAQTHFARDDQEWQGKEHADLFSVIKEVKPNVLIGTSTKPKTFTKAIVQEMAKHVERPIILPLSNPTRLHEADPADIYEWTEGKALIATGSPFPPVEYNGKKYEVGTSQPRRPFSSSLSHPRTDPSPAECNNSTIFPAVGLGAVLCRARLLSDKMLVAAVKTLAAQAPALEDPDRGLVPDVVDVRDISVHIARAVVRQAVEEGLATETGIPSEDKELEQWVRAQMWEPRYRPLVKI